MSVMPTVETKPALDLDLYDIVEADKDSLYSQLSRPIFLRWCKLIVRKYK